MRRLLSMLLLVLIGLPLATPLFALGVNGSTGVPACCRRNGQHHCAMGMDENGKATPQRAMLKDPAGSCPYCPKFQVSVHLDVFTASHADVSHAAVVSDPASVAQSECKWRIARDRSRQKRGPPLA